MKKLKLNLDEVKLESFATMPRPASGKGTVFGQSGYTVCYTCAGETCDNCVTLEPGCTGYSVAATCGQSCVAEETCAGMPTCDWSNYGTCDDSCTADGCTICNRVC